MRTALYKCLSSFSDECVLYLCWDTFSTFLPLPSTPYFVIRRFYSLSMYSSPPPCFLCLFPSISKRLHFASFIPLVTSAFILPFFHRDRNQQLKVILMARTYQQRFGWPAKEDWHVVFVLLLIPVFFFCLWQQCSYNNDADMDRRTR